MTNFLRWLMEADTNSFLTLNGLHSDFFDTLMFWSSNRWIWIPFYAWILFRLVRFYGKKILTVILFTAALIAASDQLSSNVIKEFTARPRPCHDAALEGKVHLVNNYCGGAFGFVSSHASNCFALFTFLLLMVGKKDKRMIEVLLMWAIIVSYSRIYLGVHYPGDVVCGALLGMLLGKLFSVIYFRLNT